MALRFRKSVKLFPGVRLNFSAGGISTTIGVRGASVNLGKRGAHLNLGIPGSGLSYRSQLFAPQTQAPTRERRSPLNPPPTPLTVPALVPEQSPQRTEGEIRSADIGYLTSAGLEELKRLINEATLRRRTLSQWVTDRTAERVAAERRLRNAQRFFIRLFFSKTKIARLAEDARDKREKLRDAQSNLAACSINVDFAFDQATINAFAALVRVFEELSRCEFIWDITGSVATNRVKERTLATQTVSRIPVRLALTKSDIVDSEFPALLFKNANGDDLYVYPGFVMTKSKGSDFALVDIRELEVLLRVSRFVEEETVPTDTTTVGQTWKRTNKDGSPDRRFSGNYSIPIVQYGELWLSSPTGLNEAFMFSSYLKAEAFAAGVDRYRGQLQKLASYAGDRLLSPPQAAAVPVDDDPPELDEPEPVQVRRRWLIVDVVIAVVIGFVVVSASRMAFDLFDVKGSTAIPEATISKPDDIPTDIRSEKPPVPMPPSPQLNSKNPASESDIWRPLDLTSPTISKPEMTFVQRPNVNVRAAPAPTAPVKSIAPKGKGFNVFSTNGEWVEVGELAPEGWIHNKLLGPKPP